VWPVQGPEERIPVVRFTFAPWLFIIAAQLAQVIYV